MSSIIIRKLKHANKAWKSIKSHIQSNLHKNPKFVKTIKTLPQRFVIPRRSFMYNRSNLMTKPFPSPSQYSLHQSRYSAIYVDELFPGFVSSESDHHRNPKKAVMKENNYDYDQPMKRQLHGVEENVSMIKVSMGSSDKGLGKGKAKAGERSKGVCASADKWRVPSLPQFRDIDERAEEFIRKFRRDMKLEREHSILDFQEMLKRSA